MMRARDGRAHAGAYTPRMRTPLLLLAAVLASFTFADGASARMAPEGARQSRRTLLQEARVKAQQQTDYRRPSVMALPNQWLDEPLGVGVRYADGWELDPRRESEGDLTFVVAFLAREREGVRPNANLVLENVDPAMTLDEYTALAISNEEAFLPGFALTDSTRVPLAGRTAHRVRFTAGEDAELSFEQYWFIQGGVAHIWTFADASDHFGENAPTFRSMMDSLLVR